MSKYQKQISLGYDSEGKRVRRWIHADSEQELKRKERELLQNSDQELQSKMKFGTYRQEWFAAYKTHLSVSVQEQYIYATKILSALDNKPLKNITRTDLQKIINQYYDRPNSARLLALTAKQIMDSAVADNLIAPRLWKFDSPKKQKTEKRALTAAEREAVMKADLDPRERLFVDIELYLGLRPEETRALGPNDFDLKDRSVWINKAAVAHTTGFLKSTKTGAPRRLPIPDELVSELRAYNSHFRGFYYFTDEQGNLWSRSKYQMFCRRIFAKINEALGGTSKLNLLNGMNMYTFRHNRATEIYYLSGNISTKKKAEYMGHSELMFLKTYSHLDDSKEETELLRGGSSQPVPGAVTNL